MTEKQYQFGDFVFDTVRRVLLRGGVGVAVGNRETAVLAALLEADGKPVSKQDLMNAAWQSEFVEESNLTVQIAALRKKLGTRPDGGEWIGTVHRLGYQFHPDKLGGAPAELTQAQEQPAAYGNRRLFAALAAATVCVAVAVFAGLFSMQQSPDAALFKFDPSKPSLAVLPFTNLSGGAEQDYFANGIADDLITDLARNANLNIVSRNSSFAFKDDRRPLVDAAKALGVQYLVTGSIKRERETLRINVTLTDVIVGQEMWGERFEGASNSIFELQDEVTRKILVALATKLTKESATFIADGETSNPLAHDAFLQGWEHYRRLTPEDLAKSLTYFDEAILRDPKYGRALSARALAYYDSVDGGWYAALGLTLEQAKEKAKATLAIAEQYPTAVSHLLRGDTLRVAGEFDAAIKEMQTAIALDPSDPYAYSNMANTLVTIGKPQEALSYLDAAFRIDPYAPPAYLYYFLGKAQFSLESYADAAQNIERAMKRAPDSVWWDVFLVSALCHLGKDVQVKWVIERADKNFARSDGGRLTVERADEFVFKNKEDLDRLKNGLIKCGLPSSKSSSAAP